MSRSIVAAMCGPPPPPPSCTRSPFVDRPRCAGELPLHNVDRSGLPARAEGLRRPAAGSRPIRGSFTSTPTK